MNNNHEYANEMILISGLCISVKLPNGISGATTVCHDDSLGLE